MNLNRDAYKSLTGKVGAQPDKGQEHQCEHSRDAIHHHSKSLAVEDSVSRRDFMKVVVFGATTAFLPPFTAIADLHNHNSHSPAIIRSSPQNEANPVKFPDGSLRIYYMERNHHVASISSGDNGLTWSEPMVEFEVSGETGYACRSLVDHQGRVHIWYVQRGQKNAHLPGNRHLDIWHSLMDDDGKWAAPRLIWSGYCGAIRGALQMENGRIVVPFGAWRTGNEELPENTGSNYATVIFSDDGGATWKPSSTALVSPVYDGYNGNNYGACEPCITRLPDERLWLLIRTQTGFLYQSFSDDGIHWTPAEPSRFRTSNSPAAFVDLPDSRIVVLWNNHELPPRADGQGVYGGRDGLHAAITDDGGHTWRGFREVYLDPTRNESPPRSGDRGTAYPNGEVTEDGYIILTTGQGERARAILRFHPDWLYERHRRHDFTDNGLDEWSIYKSIGPAQGWWRDRIPGAQLTTHPDNSRRRVLHVRRPDEHAADGATWNFPAGLKGTLTLRLRINTGFGGAQISLADRLFDPTDDQGEAQSVFKLKIKPNGVIDDQATFGAEVWDTIMMRWDVKKKHCEVKIGNQNLLLPLANPTINGISYLRLRSTSGTVDEAGFFVERVNAEVERLSCWKNFRRN